MGDLIKAALAHQDSITAVLAVIALALVLAIFAHFIGPYLKRVDSLQDFKTMVETFDLPKNLTELQRLTTAVKVLENSENLRNENLAEAIAGVKGLIGDLELKIKTEYSGKTRRELMDLRVTALETSVLLAKLQPVEKQQEAEAALVRAKTEREEFMAANPAL